MHSSSRRTACSLPYGGGGGGSPGQRPSLTENLPWKRAPLDRETPPGQTDACENITLPQTSFAGGKNLVWLCDVFTWDEPTKNHLSGDLFVIGLVQICSLYRTLPELLWTLHMGNIEWRHTVYKVNALECMLNLNPSSGEYKHWPVPGLLKDQLVLMCRPRKVSNVFNKILPSPTHKMGVNERKLWSSENADLKRHVMHFL